MDFLILRPLPPKTGYHFFEGGGVGGWGGWGGGQKFLLNRLQAVRTHGACNTVSGPMVTHPIPDVQASVRTPVCRTLAPPPAAAPKCADWGSNRRPHECRSAALPLGHYLDSSEGPPCCLGPYLLLTKNPNCVYLSDCLLAGSGTDWLTVNLSSRCTAEGNTISCSSFLSIATFAEIARSPGKSRFSAILGVFRFETAVDSRVTKMAITQIGGSKTRGSFDHRMR